MRHVVRQTLLRFQLLVPGSHRRRVIVGAGRTWMPGWLSTDVSTLDLLCEADWRARFAEHSLDAILAEHVWEHLTPEQGLAAAVRCRRYLRPGGYLRIAVPDGNHPNPAYIAAVRPGGSGAGATDHKLLYTLRSLSGLLSAAGFAPRPLEHWDAEGCFHAVPWEPASGMVRRSARFDQRNAGGQLIYTSLIVDGVKE